MTQQQGSSVCGTGKAKNMKKIFFFLFFFRLTKPKRGKFGNLLLTRDGGSSFFGLRDVEEEEKFPPPIAQQQSETIPLVPHYTLMAGSFSFTYTQDDCDTSAPDWLAAEKIDEIVEPCEN